MKNIPQWLLYTLAALIILWLGVQVVGRATELSDRWTNRNPNNTFPVTAEGKVPAKPDLATANFGIVTTDMPTAAAAVSDLGKKSNDLTEFLKSNGVKAEDITTASLNTYPIQDYSSGSSGRITGYRGEQMFSVKIRGVDQSVEQLQKIIGGAADNGANQFNGVNFSFDDPEGLRSQAREEAITKARAKAQDLAKAAGIKLGRVISVQESGNSYPFMPMAAGYGGGVAMDSKMAQAPSIEPGTQDIAVSMTLVFEVK